MTRNGVEGQELRTQIGFPGNHLPVYTHAGLITPLCVFDPHGLASEVREKQLSIISKYKCKKKKKKEGRGGQARNGGSNKSHQWILLNKSCHKIKSHRVLKLQFYLIYKQENSQEGAQRRGSIVRCSERVLFFFSFPHQER